MQEDKPLTIRDYIEIISALPQWAFERLLGNYQAGKIENEKTIRAIEIILEV